MPTLLWCKMNLQGLKHLRFSRLVSPESNHFNNVLVIFGNGDELIVEGTVYIGEEGHKKRQDNDREEYY